VVGVIRDGTPLAIVSFLMSHRMLRGIYDRAELSAHQ
jgi:hypothetical protein